MQSSPHLPVRERTCAICDRGEASHHTARYLSGPGHFFIRKEAKLDFKEPEDSRGMIFAKVDGKTVGLQFRHARVKTIINGVESMAYVTHCGVYHVPPDDETGPPTKICYGVSKCSPQDQFNRETGRKIALTRALLQGVHEFALSKEKREVIWKAYFDRIPKVTKEEEPPVEPAIEGILIDPSKLLLENLPDDGPVH